MSELSSRICEYPEIREQHVTISNSILDRNWRLGDRELQVVQLYCIIVDADQLVEDWKHVLELAGFLADLFSPLLVAWLTPQLVLENGLEGSVPAFLSVDIPNVQHDPVFIEKVEHECCMCAC